MPDITNPSGPLPESHLFDSSTPPASGRRNTLWLLPLLLGLTGGFVGAVIALAIATATPQLYRSVAIIRITPTNKVNDIQNSANQHAELVQTSHEKIIPTAAIVQTCLVNSKLINLASFDSLPEEQVVQHVIDKLLVSVDSPDGHNYRLRYDSLRSDDAQTILNNIIATYRKHLENQYSEAADESKFLIKNLRRELKAKLAELNENKSRLSEETRSFESLRIGRKVSIEKINETQDAHAERIELGEQVAAATKENTENQAAMIWMLRQKGELLKEPVEDLENDVILSRTAKMIDTKVQSLQVELQDELRLYGLLDAELEKLSSSIRKIEILDQKISQVQSQIAKLPAQSKVLENQAPFSFERLQTATKGMAISRNVIRSAATWGIGGTILGVLTGLLIRVVL